MVLLLRIGGVFHLACAVTHIFFPGIFSWDKRLAPLTGEEGRVILSNLNVMNWCLFLFWMMVAYLPLRHGGDMMKTAIGRTVLVSIVLFWMIRIFLFQPLFVGFDMTGSVSQTLILSAGLVLFGPPCAYALAKRESGL